VAQHRGPATTVSVLGHRAISGGWDNMVFSIDVRKGKVSTSYRGHSDWILSSAFSPDGAFASGGWANEIYLWTGREDNYYSTRITGHIDTVTSLSISPDARFLASGSYDSSIKLWSIDKKNMVKSYAGHKGRVNSLAFTQKDNIIISGGDDMTVKLWDVETGHTKGEFFCQGPATCVNSVLLDNELVLFFGDSIGNIYLSKLRQPRAY